MPILIVSALALTVLLQTFVARLYEIPSQSMETTLHGCSGCTDDRVLADKVTYDFSNPQPGDVVIFKAPPTWDGAHNEVSSNAVAQVLQDGLALVGLAEPTQKIYVKRVIATAGQTVQCCDPIGRVLVNGHPLNETYVHFSGLRLRQAFAPVTVPPGHLWVMGDNRDNSKDSRFQGGGGVNGAVDVDDVVGKARFIVLPVNRFQPVASLNPQTPAPAG